jgi:subtilisin family serine protease
MNSRSRLRRRLCYGVALALLAFCIKRNIPPETKVPTASAAEHQKVVRTEAAPSREAAAADEKPRANRDAAVTAAGGIATPLLPAPASWLRLFPRSEIVSEENAVSSLAGGLCRTIVIKTEDERLIRVIEPGDANSSHESAAQVMIADHLIVKKHPTLSWDEFEATLSKSKASIRRRLPDGNAALVRLPEFESLASFEEALTTFSNATDAIALAEPDYLRTPGEIVDDPFANSTGSWGQPYRDQWSLYTAKIMEGWDHVTAAGGVIVAVIDTGVDRGHPELAGQVWTNTAEIPHNGLDDDGNSYVDDYEGWNARENNGTDLTDIHGHGTAMAGVIAARRNNAYGIAGVGKGVKVMVLKNGNGPSFVSDNVSAIHYAVTNGARVINMSYSGKSFSQTELDSVNYAHSRGVVLVASSGNSGFEQIRYPAFYDKVISVGASTPVDQVAPFSTANRQVDLVAPGVDILSLASRWTIHEQYQGSHFMRGSGTSFSAALVSGVVSLMIEKNPALSPDEVTDILRNTTDSIDARGQYQGYGRVNALRALTLPPPPIAAITSPTNDSILNGTVAITGTATSSSFARYTLKYSPGEDGQFFVTLLASTTPIVDGVLGTWDTTLLPDGYYTLQLEVENTQGTMIRERITVQIGNTYGRLVPGWPKSIYSLPGSGTAADINGDGKVDFVGTGGFCDIGIVDSTGNPLPGWDVKRFYPAENAISQAAVGDLDGDGNPEVIFETRYQNVTMFNSAFTLRVYRKDGTIAPGWPKPLFKGIDFESHTNYVGVPVLADLNGDGALEVLTMGANVEQNGRAMIHAFRADGSALPGWPVLLPQGTLGSNSSPVVADFDGNGEMDVACVTGNGQVFVVRADGTLLPGWPVSLGSSMNVGGTTVFADFDGDAEVELFAATESGHAAIYKANGSMLAGWPQQMPSQVYAPAVADLDDDGDLEIVIPSVNQDLGGLRRMYVWHHTGQIAAGWPYIVNNASQPIILDFDGDKKLDILFSTADQTLALNFAGQMISKLGLPRPGGRTNHCLAADFDGDGRINLLVTENVVPFSIALLNYPTRPVDLDYMPWPQPGITSQKNSAYLPGRLTLEKRFLKLRTETLQVILPGKNLTKGHRVVAGGNSCSVVAETVNKLTFDLPNSLPIGVHDLVVHDAAGKRTTFQGAVIVVENLDDYDGTNSPNTWQLRFQPELVDASNRSGSYGPNGDFDGDGIPNRLEIAGRGMGWSPTRSDALSTPPIRNDGDLLVMDYVFDGTLNLEAVPEFSFDLVNWFRPGQAGAPGSFKVTEVGPGIEPGLVKWRAEVSRSGTANGYFRLRFLEVPSP